MNLLLLREEEAASPGPLVLSDRRAEHLLRVLRVEPGRRLRAGVLRGKLGQAEVLGVTASTVTLQLEWETEPPVVPSVDVVLALPRPKVLSRVLETLACFGVRRIDLVNAWRVERSYFDTPRLHPDAVTQSLTLGCEQGNQPWLPEVQVFPLFVPYLRNSLGPRLETEAAHRLVAHPRGAPGMERVFPPGTGSPVVVALGPEGGWIEKELESFCELGFTPVSLGPAVLRVEAAVVAILAQLALLRHWGGALPSAEGSTT